MNISEPIFEALKMFVQSHSLKSIKIWNKLNDPKKPIRCFSCNYELKVTFLVCPLESTASQHIITISVFISKGELSFHS